MTGRTMAQAILGRTLFDDADDLSMAMPASCQRSGRCHECVVEVVAGHEALTAPTDAESFLRPPFRLACQAAVASVDELIEFRPLRRRLRIVLGGDSTSATPIAPSPMVARSAGMVTYDAEPLDIDHGRIFGLALDVGTTTVVIELVDLETGVVVTTTALVNPQSFGGSDVMNRISYDDAHPGELRRALIRAIDHELRTICRDLAIDRRSIVEAVVVGNATMRDVVFGLDVDPIGQRPYKSSTELAMLEGRSPTTGLIERAHRIGLWMHPQGRVVSPPLIASHVGADVAADLVELDAASIRGSWMLIDIGTNTEVVVSDGERILAASCPAGPAFEGGLVRFGMPGADGAIERAELHGDAWRLETIGQAEPEGICGSGLIDMLAELRRHDRMTPKGVFADRATEVMIEPKRGITVSREDASNLAQAKAANGCGQAILLRRLGVAPQDVDHVFLAGGFATHVNVGNAIEIGFLADVRPERVHKVGNASVRGARRLLLSREQRVGLEVLVRRIEHVELEMTPDFFELFVEACQFKPLEVT